MKEYKIKLFLSHVRGCDNRFIRISELVYLNTFRLHSLAGISKNYLTVLVDRTKLQSPRSSWDILVPELIPIK